MRWSAALLSLVGAAITVTSLPGQNAGVIAFADVINALEPDVGGADERQPPVRPGIQRRARPAASRTQAQCRRQEQHQAGGGNHPIQAILIRKQPRSLHRHGIDRVPRLRHLRNAAAAESASAPMAP